MKLNVSQDNIVKFKDNRNTILEGNSAKDSGPEPLLHFYSPITGKGLLGYMPTAKETAISCYSDAAKMYRASRGSGGWGLLGRAPHLLQDMASPSHVHAASHYQHSVKWENGYEWWVANHWEDTITPKFLSFFYKNKVKPSVSGNMESFMDFMASQVLFGEPFL